MHTLVGLLEYICSFVRCVSVLSSLLIRLLSCHGQLEDMDRYCRCTYQCGDLAQYYPVARVRVTLMWPIVIDGWEALGHLRPRIVAHTFRVNKVLVGLW